MLPLVLQAPERLWWLLLLPVLFWLAMPPRPRTVVWTAHLPQWVLAQKTLRRRPPRLRGLRFLLLALACVAAVLAHAGLGLRGTPGPQRPRGWWKYSVRRSASSTMVTACSTPGGIHSAREGGTM